MKKLYFTFFFIAAFALNMWAQTTNINVVFHVLWHTAAQNIPDSVLQQQLDVLNEDYNAANPDLWKVPAAWQPIIGNMNVHFQLATTDPSGNPTTGIERYNTFVTSWSTNDAVKHYAQGGLDAWLPDSTYLNIWVCNLSAGLLGYAEFPTGNPSPTFGLVLHYSVVGRGSYATAPYNYGRTATHELAHCFGLYHLGADPGCADVDGIADTPPMSANVYGSYAPFTVITDACNPTAPGVMWMNFMSYVDDSSMYFFTQGQIDTMTYFMNNMRMMGNVPAGITTHQTGNEISLYPNPSANGIFNMNVPHPASEKNMSVVNSLGQIVEAKIHDGVIDLSAFPDGVYFLRVVESDSVTIQKLIVGQ